MKKSISQFLRLLLGKVSVVMGLVVGGLPAYAKTVDARKITCEEYVTLDEAAKPRLLLFIEGATKAGKKDAAVVEVDQLSRPLEFVTVECRKSPKATVWQKVESYLGEMSKKL